MAVRLPPQSPQSSSSPSSQVPVGVAHLLPLLLCLCCCVRLAAPLTDANWPQLSMQTVFNASKLSYEQAMLLRETVRVAASRLESLIRVLDLNPAQALLLNRSRSYCSMWLSDGKCGRLNQTYMSTGEACATDPNFLIPREFLSEIAIYNSSTVNIVSAAGEGAKAGNNFILFVDIQQDSGYCNAASVRPVNGTVCSQQWTARRPLAGLLRVCPQLIDAELAARSGRLLQQILAGLVRMLAFSNGLMADYQRLLRSPSNSAAIDEWEFLQERNILTRQMGLNFVQTPGVRRFSERHFNCSIGLPLAPNSTDAWDPVFMLPSVLSAAPVSPGVSGLDEGTLALLEDSGWYIVNYSLADRFSWGRNAGCGFSTNCSTSASTRTDSMFCSAQERLPASPAFLPDNSHRSSGSCNLIPGTNCSVIWPQDGAMCNSTGNYRSLQLQSRSRNWTECLAVNCPPTIDASNALYVVSRNGLPVNCPANTTAERSTPVEIGGEMRLVCVHISLVCPRQSSVLDLLTGFPWPTGYASSTVGIVSTARTSAQTVSLGPSDSVRSRSSAAPSSPESSLSTDAVITSASNHISTTTPAVSMSSSQTTPHVQVVHFMRPIILRRVKRSQQTTPALSENYPPAKFSIRFGSMNYIELVSRNLVPEFKASLVKALCDAFRISIDYVTIKSVRSGSVIAIWENSDPTVDGNTKLQLIRSKVHSGGITVKVDGVEYSATSVDSYTGEDEGPSFPLMEVVIGSVVGALLLIGLFLMIALVTMKHKLNRPRMQVRPRSEDTSPTSSAQTSRQCSAATSGVVQLAVLGQTSAAPSARAVADVESTLDGGRRGNAGRGGRGRTTGIERGISAGSVGLQFSDSALYFEA